MYYDKPLKCYAYLLFIDLKDNQASYVKEFMAKTPIKHLDWPGNSFLETVEYFRTSKGYSSAFPKNKTFNVSIEAISRVVHEHLQKKLNHHVSLMADRTLMPKLNKTVTCENDLVNLFDSFLSSCSLISLSSVFQLDVNSSGFYSFTKPAKFDLTSIAEHVITLGNGQGFDHDVSAKGSIKEVLNNLIQV